VLGAETSLGDPNLGGPIVTQAYNLGCLKYRPRTPDNAIYHDLSSGIYERRGVQWFRFLDPDAGMEAWGRFIVAEGYRDALNAERWELFAGRYYGESVAGYAAYLNNLQLLAAKFADRAALAGFQI
jgi:hypothetical protein